MALIGVSWPQNDAQSELQTDQTYLAFDDFGSTLDNSSDSSSLRSKHASRRSYKRYAHHHDFKRSRNNFFDVNG